MPKQTTTLKDNDQTSHADASRFRALIDNNADGILIVDDDGMIRFANPAAGEVFGVEAAALVEAPFGYPLVKGSSTEVSLRHTSGKQVTAEMRVSETQWEGERCHLVSLRDVTRRKRQEEALRASEARFSNYVENAPHGIFITDVEGCFQDVNTAACRMSGYAREELLSMCVWDLVAPEEREAARASFVETQKLGRATSALPYLRKDGGRVYWRMDAVKLSETRTLAFARDETQRRKAELQAERAAELHELLLNSLPHPAMLIHRDHVILAANRAARESGAEVGAYCWLKFNRCAFVDEEIQRYVAESDDDITPEARFNEIQCYFCQANAALKNQEPQSLSAVEAFGRLWDIHWIPIDESVFLHYTIDITERKEMENALRESRQRLDKILQTLIDGMVTVNLKGAITYANPAAERILEIHQDEIVGRYYHERAWSQIDENGEPFPPEQLPLSLALQEQQEVEDVQHGIVAPDGTSKWLSVNAAPLLDETGALYGAVASFRDITAHREIEAALQNSEQRYRTVFDYAGDAIFVHDLEGNFLDVNRVACEQLGYSRKEMLRMTPMDIAAETELEGVLAHIEQLVKKKHIVFEAQHVTKDGTAIPVEISARYISYDGQRAILSIARDITARKEAEEHIARYADALEQSNRELERFAYVISHDLQEPLRMISGYLGLLARRYEDRLDEKADMYIHYAVDGATRMQEMIKALLDLSRIETRGKAFAPTDCTEVLERTLDALHRAIVESEATVTYDPLPTLVADRAQLGQVFQNLIANALKFRRDDVPPRIHVSAERQDGAWRFAVADNGIGIAPDQADRVFQIFQRLHTREEYPGVGIGLALSKRIVERHGGRIWVKSEENDGATFYFTIPDRGKEAAA